MPKQADSDINQKIFPLPAKLPEKTKLKFMARKSKYNLVWMDLEMTGLNAEKEVIIEIATLVTDSELNILEEGPCIALSLIHISEPTRPY